jgi:mannose-6-phosphate isomerase-like protein (cupin superfamily)
MIDEQTAKEVLKNVAEIKLGYKEVEDSGTGMRVTEVDLIGAVSPPAPFKASRFTVEPSGVTPEDSHDVHEIWMIAEGEGELLYDHRPLRVRASDVVYFEPPKTHQLRNDGERTMVVYSIWWKG